MELVLVVILTVLMIPVAVFTAGVLRVVLAIAFLVFFPGYTLVAALFPKKNSLDSVERMVLILVMSIAVVPLVGIIMNYTPWGIGTYPIVGSISGLIFICSLVALLRRRGLPIEERFEPRIRFSLPRFGSGGRLDLVLSVVLCLAVVGAIGAFAYVLSVPRHVEKFSEFYLLGANGMIEDFPQEATVGQPVELTLGIANREHNDTTYNVEMTIDGESVNRIGPILLSNDEKWEDSVSIVPTEAGPNRKVELVLRKNDFTEPYLTLHLMLNVGETT